LGLSSEVQAALVSVIVTFLLIEVVGGWLRARAERKSLAGALHSEMTVLWDRYEEVMGQYLRALKPGEPFRLIPDKWIENQNFFAVFDGNTGRLGLFNPHESQQIVRAYTLGKAHVETVNMAGRYAQYLIAMGATSQLDAHFVEVGKRLKSEYERLAEAFGKSITILTRYARIRQGK
jgi:hypothetical protein